MAGPELQENAKKKPDSFFGNVSKALNNLKEFLLPKNNTEKQEENIPSKEQQEAGLVTEEILDYKNDILQNNEINKEVVSTKTNLEKFKKSAILKKDIPAYVPKYSDTQQFVEQSDRIAAPDIAQAADDLRNDVDRPFLSGLLS